MPYFGSVIANSVETDILFVAEVNIRVVMNKMMDRIKESEEKIRVLTEQSNLQKERIRVIEERLAANINP